MSFEGAPKPGPVFGPNFLLFTGIGLIIAAAAAIEGFTKVTGAPGASGGSSSGGGGAHH